MFKRIHIIGAGLSGLSAAVELEKKGLQVIVYEAAQQAGGRCRSYFDKNLETVIDNGNHLILSGNDATLEYSRMIGAQAELVRSTHADFTFFDLSNFSRWQIRLNDGWMPTWIFNRHARVPKTQFWDYFFLFPLLFARPGQTMAQVMRCGGVVWEQLLRPFFLAALNVEPRQGSAELAARLVRETLLRGGQACRPMIARNGLSKALIDPAIAYLESAGAQVQFGSRLKRIIFAQDRIEQLVFQDQTIVLDEGDAVVLAVPAHVACDFIPDLMVPDAYCAIVNAHYLLESPKTLPPLMGLIGGCAEWLFAFKDRLSVTISHGDHLLDQSREVLAKRIWQDVACAAGLPVEPMPKWQIVIEKRATFAAVPEQENKRPSAKTRWKNFVLAGDWVANGLPATIEGAIRSGKVAVQLLERKDN